MAGSGTKLWATGDLVTSSAFNTYLQDQVIAVFAGSSARDAAYGGAGEPTIAEGMACFLKDVNQFQIYSGSAWVSIIDLDTFSESSGVYTIANAQLSIKKDSGSAQFTLLSAHDTEASTGIIEFLKQDGSIASPAAVDDNATLGRLDFYGYDGNSYALGAQIRVLVDGSPADGDMPAEMVFQVTPDGGSETPVTALTLKPTGEARFTADNDITDFTSDTHGVIGMYNSDGAVDDFTCLDWIGNGVQAAARIAMKYTGGGSELHFGTSSTYGDGITNTAIRIQPDGHTKIGDAAGASPVDMFDVGDGTANGSFRVHAANGGESFRVVTSVVRAANIVNTTSASAANVYINSSNNTIYMSTSSGRYKTDIEDLEDSYADKLLDLRPVWFRSLCEDDPEEYSYYGLIAEEVEEVEPRFVAYGPSDDCECLPDDEDDPDHVEHHLEGCLIPQGVQYDRIVPHLINLLKRQDARIKALEAS